MTNVWTLLSPVDSPSNNRFFSMVYDPVNDNVVMFGGEAEGSFPPLDLTWLWNGTDWTDAAPATTPPGRTRGAFARHAGSSRLVLYGGFDGSSLLSDTWTWDGTTWTEESPSHVPGAHYGVAAYDADADVVVMIVDGTTAGDPTTTWLWNGTDWTDAAPATTPLTTIAGAAMAWDEANSNIVLYGAHDEDESDADNTWLWNGTDWTKVLTVSLGFELANVSAVYAPLTGSVLMWGGVTVLGGLSNCVNELWSWDGAAWTSLSGGISPSARASPIVANPTNLLLYGGYVCTPFGAADTWEYAPGEAPPAGSIPFLHSHHSTV